MKLNYSFVGSVLFTFSLSICQSTFSQTGAGGVGNAGTNVIWLDANTIIQANGTQVSSFADVSGNGNNLSQGTFVKQPLFNTAVVNGLPAVQFDGNNDLLARGATPALESTNLTYFIVFKRANLTSQMLITAGYASNSPKWRTYCNSGSNSLISAHFSPTIKHTSYTDAGTPTFISTHITPTQIRVYKLGVQQALTNAAYTAPTGHQNLALGNTLVAGPNNYSLNGFVAEVVVYNSALNNLQRIIVENYLGAKYNMTIPTDLYAFEATHNIGLIAVGNNGVNTQTSAEGNGILNISNPTAMASNEYLLLAHTNVPLTALTGVDMPLTLPGYARWSRTWRAGETGDVGNVTLVYDLSGGNDFGVSSTYRLLVDNVTQNGDFSDANELVGVYDGIAQTLTFTLNLNSGDYFTIAAGPQEIHAINTGLWSDPNTWDCLCVPNSINNNVYIDANVAVTLDMNATVDYFSIADPGGLLICSSSQALTIMGDWDLLGGVNLTDGSIIMAGTANQYVDAGGTTVIFNDFEVNNSGGIVTFYESEYILNGVFYPTLGGLTLDPTPANQFIINSTSALTTARIAPIGTSFTFNGTYTIRRFLPSGVADWRDLASPLNGAQLWMWDNSIAISGVGFPDGCAFGGGGCFYSVLYYENNVAIEVTDILDPLVVGRGYEVFIGDDLNTFSSATLEVRGTLNDGQNVVLPVSANYSTLGNPYASPILWDNISLSGGVGNFFYVYDPATGFYEYYDGSDGSSSIPELASGEIAMGQGFWVEGPGTVTITDGSKTSAGTFIRSIGEDKSLSLYLKENSSTYMSSIALQQLGESSDAMDFLLDVPNFSTGNEKAPTIAMYSGEEEMIRKNYIKDDFRNKSFELYTKILNAGYYTIEASNIENFNNYLKVLLYDNTTGQFINLKSEPSYTFYSDITEGHRFTLIFSNQVGENEESIQALTINEEIENGLTITQMGHTFNIVSTVDYTEDSQIKLVNVLGQQEVFYQSIKFVNGSNMISIPEEYKGVHILVITTGDKTVTKKVVL